MCWARKKIIKGCFQRIPAAKHRTAANVIPARCRGGEGKKKSIQMMSGKHFKAHEVSCCIKYFIFGFNIIFWVSPPSAVCDFRPAIVSLTRWHALCSQSAAVRCIYVCVCVCCGVLCCPGFRFASTFSFAPVHLLPVTHQPALFSCVLHQSENSSLSRHHRVFTWP